MRVKGILQQQCKIQTAYTFSAVLISSIIFLFLVIDNNKKQKHNRTNKISFKTKQ